jgi:hypothetical protein
MPHILSFRIILLLLTLLLVLTTGCALSEQTPAITPTSDPLPQPIASLTPELTSTPEPAEDMDRTILFRTQDSIWGITLSPDGTQLAVGVGDPRFNESQQARIVLIDAGTGVVHSELTVMPDGCRLQMLDWGKNELMKDEFIAAAGACPPDYEAVIIIWDAFTGTEIQRFGENLSIANFFDLEISPDGTKVAIATATQKQMSLVLWNILDQRQIAFSQNNQLNRDSDWVQALAWSPDGQEIAFMLDTNFPFLWAWEDPQQIRFLEASSDLHNERLEWSSEGVIAGGEGSGLALWDARTGGVITEIDLPYPLTDLKFSPDGSLLVVTLLQSGDAPPEPKLLLFDGRSGTELDRLTNDIYFAGEIAWLHDGTGFAVIEYRLGRSFDDAVTLFSLK